MRSGLESKILIVTVIVIYCLTPYTMRQMNGGCRCGCQEYICYCCRSAEHFGDMAPVMECSENTSDESFEQSPAMTVYASQLAVILDQLGGVHSPEIGSALPGYKEPPMKPPRSI